MQTLIMKFGGASLATPEHYARVVEIILERKVKYPRLVVVVSAMGNTTDKLIELAKQIHPNPPRREYDMLITVGERISMSLLAMALAAKQQNAVSFTGSQSGIITCSRHTDAKIIDVRPHRLLPQLETGNVVIVAGFQGVSKHGEITTLGRGGSDTTAVALGIALEAAKVEFFKDVPGIFAEDPKHCKDAKPFPFMTYEEALHILSEGKKEVLHSRSVLLASKNRLPLHVRSFNDDLLETRGTLVLEERSTPLIRPIYEEETA